MTEQHKIQIINIALSDDYGVQKTRWRRWKAWWSRHRRYYGELRYDFGWKWWEAVLGSLMFK